MSSVRKKLTDPLSRPDLGAQEALDEFEKRLKKLDRFIFRIATNLALVENVNFGDKREHYIANAIVACKELQEWSEQS